MRTKQNNGAQGFTSDFTVCMILLCFIGAVLFFLGNRRRPVTASKNSCINNLRQIDGAKEQWALESKKAPFTAPDTIAICQYIKGGMPVCAEGGKYHFNLVDMPPYCSIAKHTLAGYNCEENLNLLQNAKQSWAQEQKGGATNIPEFELFGFGRPLREKPTCPQGGQYHINPVGEPPACTFPKHSMDAFQNFRADCVQKRRTLQPPAAQSNEQPRIAGQCPGGGSYFWSGSEFYCTKHGR